MEKAYVVTSGDYSDYSIERVFSTRKMAEDFCDRHDDSYRVEEYCVDKDLPPRETQVFKVSISISKGKSSVEATADTRLAGLFMADSFYFGIQSSANINTTPRTEQASITMDKGIYDFYRSYFDGINSFV